MTAAVREPREETIGPSFSPRVLSHSATPSTIPINSPVSPTKWRSLENLVDCISSGINIDTNVCVRCPFTPQASVLHV